MPPVIGHSDAVLDEWRMFGCLLSCPVDRLQMPLKIHPAVQDTHNIDPVGIAPEEDHMRANRMFPISRPHLITSAGDAGRAPQGLNGSVNLPDIRFSPPGAPAFSRIVPDILQIRLCPRRKTMGGHASGTSAPHLRAMNASKSNDSGVPLCSPSIRADRRAASLVSWSSSSRRPERTTSLALP